MKRSPNLTLRQNYCVLIAAHFAAGSRRNTLHFMRDGINVDRLPETMFSELFLQLSLLLGFPTMLEGLGMLRSIAVTSSLRFKSASSEKRIRKDGRKVLERVYGNTVDRLLANLKHMHAIIPDVIVRDVYGRILSRPGLSLRERELVNVAVLTIQDLEQQLYSHIRGALRLGVPRDGVRTVIVLAARIAGVSPRKALKILSSFNRSGAGKR